MKCKIHNNILKMNGITIKKILIDLDITQASLARMLDDSPQNLNSALSSTDIRTGLLEKIAKVLNKPMSLFYQGSEFECLFEKQERPLPPANYVTLEAYADLIRENERLKIQIAQLKEGKNNQQ